MKVLVYILFKHFPGILRGPDKIVVCVKNKLKSTFLVRSATLGHTLIPDPGQSESRSTQHTAGSQLNKHTHEQRLPAVNVNGIVFVCVTASIDDTQAIRAQDTRTSPSHTRTGRRNSISTMWHT